jgi:hypothetical protein
VEPSTTGDSRHDEASGRFWVIRYYGRSLAIRPGVYQLRCESRICSRDDALALFPCEHGLKLLCFLDGDRLFERGYESFGGDLNCFYPRNGLNDEYRSEINNSESELDEG